MRNTCKQYSTMQAVVDPAQNYVILMSLSWEINPDAQIQICGGHAGRAYIKKLQSYRTRKTFNPKFKKKYEKEFPEVNTVKCPCTQQASMTQEYEQQRSAYHWKLNLLQRLKLPVYEGVPKILESLNKKTLDKVKTTKAKKR